MSCEIIDCKMLFDAIKQKRNRFFLANTILMLEIDDKAKIKIAKYLLKEKDAFVWFMAELKEDNAE